MAVAVQAPYLAAIQQAMVAMVSTVPGRKMAVSAVVLVGVVAAAVLATLREMAAVVALAVAVAVAV